jgi:CubicO group peptidase (beta-lactamase class C family)
MTVADRLASGLDDAIQRAIQDNRIIGAVAAVMVKGELVYCAAHGLADRKADRPMRTDAIFLLASMSKPITSAAALALIEAGVFDLDTPVTDHLPDFRPPFADREPRITVRHLLTHTSGLFYPFQEPEDGPAHEANVSSGLDQPGLSGPKAMARLATVPLRFLPGTAFNYSLSLDVLGEFMARAVGRSLGDIVRDTVTGPLGMRDTDFAVTDPSRLVAHYGVDAGGQPLRMQPGYQGPTAVSPAPMDPTRLFDPNSYHSGGGGLAGTAGDLLRFFEAIRLGGAPILSPSSVSLMTENALPPSIPQALEPGWTYGMGTETLSDPDRATGPEHPAAYKGSGGYGHRWFIDPALGLTAVTLTNSAPEGLRGRFATDTRDAIYAAIDGARLEEDRTA